MAAEHTGFEGESAGARNLISGKPRHWPYRLAGELLRLRAEGLRRRWAKGARGRTPEGASMVDEALLMELGTAITDVTHALNTQLAASWRSPNDPATPGTIQAACDAVTAAAFTAIAWGEKVRALPPSPLTDAVRPLLLEQVDHFLAEFEAIPKRFSGLALALTFGGPLRLRITFTSPPGWKRRFKAAMRRARSLIVQEALAEMRARRSA
ncbi:hypothetical protein UAJ10_29530 [Nitrospirillum sp. BR 11164]|uniref:hypothetical protein n=1 Tax=Nitrospirillum sp. BR 11164 TaxID=3104324 RepID=UPI002AFFC114|nr:hypothetical protein [Nitrospirillum sp. BR 11164]MEA1653146.1 hypothetical protein [Nitrospirillum sp. BR 11164]